MKKNLLPLCALAIAITSVAFTTRPFQIDYFHIFNGASDANLNNQGSWTYEAIILPSNCSGLDETICYVMCNKNEAEFRNYIHGKTKWNQFMQSCTAYTREVF